MSDAYLLDTIRLIEGKHIPSDSSFFLVVPGATLIGRIISVDEYQAIFQKLNPESLGDFTSSIQHSDELLDKITRAEDAPEFANTYFFMADVKVTFGTSLLSLPTMRVCAAHVFAWGYAPDRLDH